MDRQVFIEKYGRKYSDNGFKDKIRRVTKSVGREALMKIMTLYYVLKSEDVALVEKAKICAALGYFIVPMDIVGDFVPFVGYADDLMAIAWALNSVRAKVTPEIERLAEEQVTRLLG